MSYFHNAQRQIAAGASGNAASHARRGNWDLAPAQAALHSARDAKEIANDVRQGRSVVTADAWIAHISAIAIARAKGEVPPGAQGPPSARTHAPRPAPAPV